jgi:multicomponent Na+:H+ antiporter subunit E
MNLGLMIVVLALGWAAATGSFSLLNLMFGAFIALVALALVRDRVTGPRISRRLRRVLALLALFLYELFLSALKVALLVVRPDMRQQLQPGIIAFPLRVTSDAEIALLANLITLTPGTLSVDVSEDRRYLFVHALDVVDRDALVSDIADGFETRVMEVFR